MKTYNVYIIQTGPFIKIGVSSNIAGRVEQIETCNPYPVIVLALLPFNSEKQAYSEEKRLHRSLKHYHVKGEWFRKKGFEKALKHELYVSQNKKHLKTVKSAKWELIDENESAELEIAYNARQLQ